MFQQKVPCRSAQLSRRIEGWADDHLHDSQLRIVRQLHRSARRAAGRVLGTDPETSAKKMGMLRKVVLICFDVGLGHKNILWQNGTLLQNSKAVEPPWQVFDTGMGL